MIMLRIFFCACLVVLTCKSAPPKPITVSFNGNKWQFPLSVGEAVKQYNLSYKPPGHYYTESQTGSVVTLEYLFQAGDFDNEHQPKEVLYDRQVHSYIHSFPFRPGLMDSLRHVLEAQFKQKMVMDSDTQRFGLTKLPANLQNMLPDGGSVTYGLIRADSSLKVGLRKPPTFSKSSPQFIEVLFLYNRSEEQIEKRMISF
ncbi:hypothetical protein [Spirosoma areae]